MFINIIKLCRCAIDSCWQQTAQKFQCNVQEQMNGSVRTSDGPVHLAEGSVEIDEIKYSIVRLD